MFAALLGLSLLVPDGTTAPTPVRFEVRHLTLPSQAMTAWASDLARPFPGGSTGLLAVATSEQVQELIQALEASDEGRLQALPGCMTSASEATTYQFPVRDGGGVSRTVELKLGSVAASPGHLGIAVECTQNELVANPREQGAAEAYRVTRTTIGATRVDGSWVVRSGDTLLIRLGTDGKTGPTSNRELVAVTAYAVEPVANAVATARLPMPNLPTRTLPPGIHPDGTAAEQAFERDSEVKAASATVPTGPVSPSPQATPSPQGPSAAGVRWPLGAYGWVQIQIGPKPTADRNLQRAAAATEATKRR